MQTADNITQQYEIRFLFESGYDQAPKIWAFEFYKDKDGDWNSTHDIADRYDFTSEDIDWLIANWRQSDGSKYEDISDFEIDDYFNQYDQSFRDMLPPKAIEWLDNLSEYIFEDLSVRELNEA